MSERSEMADDLGESTLGQLEPSGPKVSERPVEQEEPSNPEAADNPVEPANGEEEATGGLDVPTEGKVEPAKGEVLDKRVSVWNNIPLHVQKWTPPNDIR